MNMLSASRLTAAETALIEAFNARIGELPGDGAVIAMRDRLLDELKTRGLPTRRVEAWHYTDLKTLLRDLPPETGDAGTQSRPTLVEGSPLLAAFQGHPDGKAAGEGLVVSAFADALADGAAAAGLAALGADDAIGRINGAFVRDGYALRVEEGRVLDLPVEVQLLHGGGQIHTRLPIAIGKGSRTTLVERHLAVTDAPALASHVTELSVGENAELTYVILQQQGALDTHLGQLRLEIAAGAKVKLFVVNAGGKLVRQELAIRITGEDAELTLRGINLLGGDTHTDVTMVLAHEVPHTASTEVLRNVVFDRARGVFQGMIRVAPDAQKTDAKMACNTLLMSDEAEFFAKPELEIFADDVQCGHGATVADIDDNHLYYLMARGIPKSKARAMLVNAFVAEIVEEIDDEALTEALEAVVTDWLEQHA